MCIKELLYDANGKPSENSFEHAFVRIEFASGGFKLILTIRRNVWKVSCFLYAILNFVFSLFYRILQNFIWKCTWFILSNLHVISGFLYFYCFHRLNYSFYSQIFIILCNEQTILHFNWESFFFPALFI